MKPLSHVAILVHENDDLETHHYFLLEIAVFWRQQGIRVTILRGLDHAPAADLLILHVDLTEVPLEYQTFMRRYPVVLNAAVLDIAKDRYSVIRVRRRDRYPGPVIVKTKRNYGGIKEAALAKRRSRFQRFVRRLVGRFHWSLRPNQENSNYRIFDSVSEVPFPVWWNPALIVEEFAPEMREGFYCLRTWTFLGDRETNSLSYSRRPIVKLSNVERREVVDEIPDELRRMRSQMGFEFGKFDYGIVDGRVLLYDANRTPSLGAEVPASFVDRLRHLADGIHAYLPDIIDDVDESTPPPGHWSDVARLWQQVGAPLRPCETDLDFLRERIDGWAREHGAPRALILGVTPEFHRLPWPDGTDLLATDNNRNMIDAIWPGRAEQVIEHDWISLPFDSASRDIVLCDGGLHLVRPSDQKALVETLGRILAPGGLCFFRLFVPPAERESPEFVLEDLIAGRIPNLNILKLRLGMALQPTMIEGVGVAEVWNRVHSACPDFEALADRIGWSLEHLLALETYRESPNRYHFLTVAEVRTLFCSVPDSPARFSVEEVATPKYALGERCPTILLRRRD